jgi:hypothetical protein
MRQFGEADEWELRRNSKGRHSEKVREEWV